MVLNELGQKISQALAMVNNAETIDEKVHAIGKREIAKPELLSFSLSA